MNVLSLFAGIGGLELGLERRSSTGSEFIGSHLLEVVRSAA